MSATSATAADSVHAELLKHAQVILDCAAQTDVASSTAPLSAAALRDTLKEILPMLRTDRDVEVLDVFISVGAEVALLRLLDRYFDSAGDDETAILESAIWVWMAIIRQWHNGFRRRINMTECLRVMVRLLSHTKSSVRHRAASCLTFSNSINGQGLVRDILLQSQATVGVIARTLDQATDERETKMLVLVTHNLVFGDPPGELGVVLPLVQVMAKLLREHVQDLFALDENTLGLVVEFFDKMSRSRSEEYRQAVIDFNIPAHVVQLIVQHATLPPSSVDYVACNLMRVWAASHAEVLLDAGGLTAIQALLRKVHEFNDVLMVVMQVLDELTASHSPSVRQQIVDCDGLIWDACNAVFAIQDHESEDFIIALCGCAIGQRRPVTATAR